MGNARTERTTITRHMAVRAEPRPWTLIRRDGAMELTPAAVIYASLAQLLNENDLHWVEGR